MLPAANIEHNLKWCNFLGEPPQTGKLPGVE